MRGESGGLEEAARGLVRSLHPASARGVLVFFALAAAAALALYRPALTGPFFSDDFLFLPENVYLHGLDPGRLWAFVNPWSDLTKITLNYAPVHVLLHALEWQLFGEEVVGYHVVNVLVHAGASAALLAVFLRTGVPLAAAWLGAALFLVHPANVEAVAWIFQLKTSAALLLACGALLAHGRSPALGTLLFALGLLAKPTAAFALPVAVALEWAGRPGASGPADAPARRRRLALGVWALLLGAFAWIELSVFAAASVGLRGFEELGVQIRTIAALGARYLAMALTSWGIAPFQDPPRARSLVDPWWLASLPLAALLGGRLVWSLLRRRVEGAYWVWAGAGFLPVSQVFPFLFPMADRYLYFILPGLIGGTALWLREAGGGELARRGGRVLPYGLALTAALLGVFFAVRTANRAWSWRHPPVLIAEAARAYPEGIMGHTKRAVRAAERGDAEAAVAELRMLSERGVRRFEQFATDPAYAPIRAEPEFQEMLRDMARWWVENRESFGELTTLHLRSLARAHLVLGRPERAEEYLERAVALGGPFEPSLREALARLREREASGAEGPSPQAPRGGGAG